MTDFSVLPVHIVKMYMCISIIGLDLCFQAEISTSQATGMHPDKRIREWTNGKGNSHGGSDDRGADYYRGSRRPGHSARK